MMHLFPFHPSSFPILLEQQHKIPSKDLNLFEILRLRHEPFGSAKSTTGQRKNILHRKEEKNVFAQLTHIHQHFALSFIIIDSKDGFCVCVCLTLTCLYSEWLVRFAAQ